MTVISKYPIFEADQVLSNQHLNGLVTYLEAQDRAIRKGLIGIGIVCGMDISFPTETSIKIGCGTAVTSLGFQINWEEKTFSRYKPVEKLSDAFLAPNLVNEPFLKPVFDYAPPYGNVFTDFEELVSDGGTSIPNTDFLKDKVVVLLLEALLIDQKNCSETSCDDKGKRLEFNLRPVLVSASKIDNSGFLNSTVYTSFEPVSLPRYNAPQVTLINGVQILNTFSNLVQDKKVIEQLDTKISAVYRTFQDSYYTSIQNYLTLANVRTKIREVTNANRSKLHIQYVWDWINDIASAYNEIVSLNEETSLSYCCPSGMESKFPFHVMLGKIETLSAKISRQDITESVRVSISDRVFVVNYNVLSANPDYITPWFKISENSDNKPDGKEEMRALLERLVLILNNFSVLNVEEGYMDALVRITPSFLGDYPLSKKSIPYYYNQISALSKVWNPKLNNSRVLGYYASQYSTVDSTVYPLNYDIEPYDFFRIEGVIGKPYKNVLSSLLTIQKTSQVPFKVVAVNAINLDNVVVDISDFLGEWSSIELDYELVSRRWEGLVGKTIEWFQEGENPKLIAPYFQTPKSPSEDYIQTSYGHFVNLLKQGRDYMYKDFADFMKIYKPFIETYEKIEKIAIQQRKRIFEGLVRDENQIFAKDLISYLDRLIYVCQKGEFRALYQTAQEQWKNASDKLTLSKFIDKHPGMEHKAGVAKGGTLILVYQDKSIVERQIIKTKSNPNIVIKKDATIDTFKRKVQDYASYYLPQNTFTQLVVYMDNLVKDSLMRQDLYEIPDEAVIADFYLPYLCCTEGGGEINFILNNNEPVPPDFNDSDFDSEDFYAGTVDKK